MQKPTFPTAPPNKGVWRSFRNVCIISIISIANNDEGGGYIMKIMKLNPSCGTWSCAEKWVASHRPGRFKI